MNKPQIEKLNEQQLRQQIIMPLLKKMGYKDVTETHGNNELGRDIVCWTTDDNGNRVNVAVVAKTVRMRGKISAGKGTLQEVYMQLSQCFGEPFEDPVQVGVKRTVDKCIVVSNIHSRQEFINGLAAVVRAHEWVDRVEFWNGSKLWDLYKEHVQSLAAQVAELRQKLDSYDPHYFPEVKLTIGGTEVELVEKSPGALQQGLAGASIKFTMMETPEGEEANRAMHELFAKGSPVVIPPTALKSVEFPELLEQLVGGTTNMGYKLESKPDPSLPPFLARIALACDDGDSFAFDFVHLRLMRAGTEQWFFSSEGQVQPLPVIVDLTIDHKNLKVTVSFRNHLPSKINVYKLMHVLQLQRCLSKRGVVRVVHLETGIQVFEMPYETGIVKAPTPRYLSVIEDLSAIQQRVGRPIVLPDRKWTKEEREIIAELRTILHEGGYTATWGDGWFDLPAWGAAILLEKLKDGAVALLQEEEEVVKLFGTELPLGLRQYQYLARLTNEAQVREELARHLEDATAVTAVGSIRAEFAPYDENSVRVEFADWQPSPKTAPEPGEQPTDRP